MSLDYLASILPFLMIILLVDFEKLVQYFLRKVCRSSTQLSSGNIMFSIEMVLSIYMIFTLT